MNETLTLECGELDTVIRIDEEGHVMVWRAGQPVSLITRLVLVADSDHAPILQIVQRATPINPVSSKHYRGIITSSIDNELTRWE